MSTINQDARAQAAWLRETALQTGGAVGVRMTQAAAVLEQLAPVEPEAPAKNHFEIARNRVRALDVDLLAPLNIITVCALAVDPDDDIELRHTLRHAVGLLEQISSDMADLYPVIDSMEAAGGAQ